MSPTVSVPRRIADETLHTLLVQREHDGPTPELDAQILDARRELCAVSAADYNELATQQRRLTATIEAALGAIATAVAEKERLAVQQKDLQLNGVGLARVELTTKEARVLVLRTVLQRLEQGLVQPIQPHDWTGRSLRSDGEFE